MGKKITTPEGETTKIESRYQPGMLRQCIADNLSADAMMKHLGILNKSTLRKHLLRLMADDKVFYDIENLFNRSSSMPKVNPKGRLTLNLRGIILAGQEVADGQLFNVRVEPDHIVITRA